MFPCSLVLFLLSIHLMISHNYFITNFLSCIYLTHIHILVVALPAAFPSNMFWRTVTVTLSVMTAWWPGWRHGAKSGCSSVRVIFCFPNILLFGLATLTCQSVLVSLWRAWRHMNWNSKICTSSIIAGMFFIYLFSIFLYFERWTCLFNVISSLCSSWR